MNYESLEQRVMSSFYIYMPDFHGCVNDKCSLEEQRNLYEFLRNIYKDLYDNPLLLFTNLHEDYSYPNVFSVANSGKEDLAPLFKKIRNTVNDILLLLIDIGKNGIINTVCIMYSIKLSKRVKTLLERNGLVYNDNKIEYKKGNFFNALKWFCNVDYLTLRRFATLSFDPNYDYLTPMLIPHLEKEKGAMNVVINWLIDNNYKIIDGCNKYPKIDECIVNYIKKLTDKEELLGFAYMGDKSHIGFSIEYRYQATYPVFCTIRVQKMKEILQDFDKLSDNIKKFLSNNLKKCDSCNYCIQLNKDKPRAHIKASFDNKTYLLCPYYPGFSLSFRDITKEKADQFIEFMQLVEEYNL